jgi:hypothetical protein
MHYAAAWITLTVVWDDDSRNTCTAFTTKYFSNMLQSTHSQTDCKLCLYWAGKNAIVTTTMSARAANANVPVAAKFHHRDPSDIGEQGVERDR